MTWLFKEISDFVTKLSIDRQQYMEVNDIKSSLSQVTFGAPQRSILGPVLFNVYVCDLQDTVSATTTFLQYVNNNVFYG